MFVILFKNGNDSAAKSYFDGDYIALVVIKDFNALISNNIFWSASKEQTGSLWKTYQNVKKWWLCNRELPRLFISPNIINWHKFMKTNKYKYFPKK